MKYSWAFTLLLILTLLVSCIQLAATQPPATTTPQPELAPPAKPPTAAIPLPPAPVSAEDTPVGPAKVGIVEKVPAAVQQMPVTGNYVTPTLALGFGLVAVGAFVYRRRG